MVAPPVSELIPQTYTVCPHMPNRYQVSRTKTVTEVVALERSLEIETPLA